MTIVASVLLARCRSWIFGRVTICWRDELLRRIDKAEPCPTYTAGIVP